MWSVGPHPHSPVVQTTGAVVTSRSRWTGGVETLQRDRARFLLWRGAKLLCGPSVSMWGFVQLVLVLPGSSLVVSRAWTAAQ